MNTLAQPVSTAFDIVANQEPKALTYMGLLDLGEATCSALGQHMIDRFDIEGLLSVSAIGAYAVTFAKYNFAGIEEKPSRFSSRIVRHFEALDDEVVPAIGATLGWSQKSVDIPLDWVLSETSSRSSRAPTNSIAILEAALSGGKATSLAREQYTANDSHNSRVNDLIANGILVKDPIRVKIGNPVYNGFRPFEKLTFITQHTYKILEAAKQMHADREWTIAELVDYSVGLLPQHLQDDAALKAGLARRITQTASLGNPRISPGAIHKVECIKGVTVKVADKYAEPIADLVERAHQLQSSPVKRMEFRDTAYDIYKDISTARSLMMKTKTKATPYNNVNDL